ncbi:S-adenosyl-L-methionine-dependent methyltransferase [Ascobolus immersus RN42]|uniref:S-adenosyl-L-methionine-dependent methyltransferase n=1 Tax=Ascobolus immersus RN42 TaxID=1160509 RepID=A0A3N4HXS3_ASCIM|nr:S-adenosyl-L-methionine-dependent methyltransferase [Ascobolus immersus RN42]
MVNPTTTAPKAPTDDWNSTTYSTTVAPFVPALTTKITALLAPQASDVILDLGCGDGVLTKDLAAHAKHIVAIDSSANMIEAANKNYSAPNVEYHVWDGADLAGFQAEHGEKQYDKVFSNAAIHWIMGSPDTLDEAKASTRRAHGFAGIFAALKPNGLFISESGGHLNCADIRAALFSALLANGVTMQQIKAANPWWFPTVAEMRKELEKAGFEVELVEEEFRPTELTKEEDGGAGGWVRLFCARFLRLVEDEEKREEVVRSVAEVLEFVGGHGDVEGGSKCGYVRIRVVARRPEVVV